MQHCWCQSLIGSFDLLLETEPTVCCSCQLWCLCGAKTWLCWRLLPGPVCFWKVISNPEMRWPVGAAPLLQGTLSPPCCSHSCTAQYSLCALQCCVCAPPGAGSPEYTVKLCCSKPADLKLLIRSYRVCYYILLFISCFVNTVPCLAHQ